MRQRRPIAIGLFCTVVTALLYSSMAGLVNLAIGAVEILAQNTGPERNAAQFDQGYRQLVLACLLTIAVFSARYWFTRGQTFYLQVAANQLAADLRERMFRKLLRLPVSYFTDKRTGAIQSVLTNDVNVFQSAVGIIRDSIDGPIKAVAAFAWIFWLQWELGLAALAIIPGMAWVINHNSRRMKVAQAAVQRDLAEVGAAATESLQGSRVIKAFNAESRVTANYRTLLDQCLSSQREATMRTASLRPMVEWLGAVGLAGVFFLTGILASQGRLQVSDVAAIVVAMDMVNQGFRSLANVSNTLASVRAANDRIYTEILDVPEGQEVSGGRRLDAVRGEIQFDCVSFAYPDGTWALRDVSFTIDPGTSLALVGPSGAGKSTIADLVLRFYDPTEGVIRLDGVDIRELDITWLREQMGVVPQTTYLFAGSISDNLRLGAPDATDQEVRRALEAAHATEFVTELAERPVSELGEAGIRLSGGQRQRIAIARALLRSPRILLLDEATSALDAESERVVTEALAELMQTRTTLFIAHRLTTAARADRILVLRRGEVVETGSHAELMAARGMYAGLFAAFSGGVLD